MTPFRWDPELSADPAPLLWQIIRWQVEMRPTGRGVVGKAGEGRGREQMKAQKTKTRGHRPRSVAAEKASVPDLSPTLPKGRGEERGTKAKAKSQDFRRCRE